MDEEQPSAYARFQRGVAVIVAWAHGRDADAALAAQREDEEERLRRERDLAEDDNGSGVT